MLCTDMSPTGPALHGKGPRRAGGRLPAPGVPPASFDAVSALNCLLHVPTPDLPPVLKALSEVLVPGGLLYVGTWGGPNQEGPVADPRYPVPRFFAFRSDEVMRQLLAGQFDILSFAAFDRGDNDRFSRSSCRRPRAEVRAGRRSHALVLLTTAGLSEGPAASSCATSVAGATAR